MDTFVLYIHVPFCLHKCPYCDFNTYAVTQIPDQEYADALLAELDARISRAEWQNRTISSIFFGGGTPSLLSEKTIARILNSIRSRSAIASNAEITLEANPGSTSYDRISGFINAGINRISFGAQSFNDKTLRTLGRIHTPEQVELAVADARAAGFKNINLDLIYGVPGQTLDELHQDLNRMTSANIEHISTYHLTIEHGTPFFSAERRGAIKMPPEELVVDMMHVIQDGLSKVNFNRYEISNFSLPDYHSRHNCSYWLGHDYLGLGAGAHSFCRVSPDSQFGFRWANYALPKEYIARATSGGFANSWSEKLSLEDAIFERIFLGLRLIRGINLIEFSELFDLDLATLYPTVIPDLTDQGLVEICDGNLRLSEKGLFLADSVISEFAKPCVQNTPPAIVPKC